MNMNMNKRELPLFLKQCLIYDRISKRFNITIPIDVSEQILRYLCSKERKNFHTSIKELKQKITENKNISVSFCKSYLQYNYIHREFDIYTDSPIEDISRYLTLYKCPLDFANKQMIDACYPHLHGIYQDHGNMEMVNSPILQANIFLEYVDPPWIRPSQERMSLENKRDQFYKHSEKQVEDEAEYYIYLIKSLLLKGLPLKEIR